MADEITIGEGGKHVVDSTGTAIGVVVDVADEEIRLREVYRSDERGPKPGS